LKVLRLDFSSETKVALWVQVSDKLYIKKRAEMFIVGVLVEISTTIAPTKGLKNPQVLLCATSKIPKLNDFIQGPTFLFEIKSFWSH
jgi:hypothetical protein